MLLPLSLWLSRDVCAGALAPEGTGFSISLILLYRTLPHNADLEQFRSHLEAETARKLCSSMGSVLKKSSRENRPQLWESGQHFPIYKNKTNKKKNKAAELTTELLKNQVPVWLLTSLGSHFGEGERERDRERQREAGAYLFLRVREENESTEKSCQGWVSSASSGSHRGGMRTCVLITEGAKQYSSFYQVLDFRPQIRVAAK